MKLREVQDRSFELLCMIDDACRAEQVPYFLEGGTLIGAVREKGLIPWDDDIDIKVRIQDYPRFRAAMQKHLPPHIRLVEPSAFAPGFYDFVVRIVDTRCLRRKVTEADRYYHLLQNQLCIDVFLLHPMPEHFPARAAAFLHLKTLYGFGLGHRYHLQFSDYPLWTRPGIALLAAIGKHIPVEVLWERYLKKIQRLGRLASPFSLCSWLTWDSLQQTAWFRTSVPVTLRGRTFPAPVGYDPYLRSYYGDYMRPPADRMAFIQHLDAEDRYTDS